MMEVGCDKPFGRSSLITYIYNVLGSTLPVISAYSLVLHIIYVNYSTINKRRKRNFKVLDIHRQSKIIEDHKNNFQIYSKHVL